MWSDNARRRIRAVLRIALFVTCGLLLAFGLLLLVVPTLDGPHSGQRKNESTAVGKLRTILKLQDHYIAAHAGNEVACELPMLMPIDQREFPEHFLDFLNAASHSGYKFSLVSCRSDANRARVQYQVTAVPVERGVTGVRAFCADETEVIWYDADGSSTNCLAFRHPLELTGPWFVTGEKSHLHQL
jgi:hypothetical protein